MYLWYNYLFFKVFKWRLQSYSSDSVMKRFCVVVTLSCGWCVISVTPSVNTDRLSLYITLVITSSPCVLAAITVKKFPYFTDSVLSLTGFNGSACIRNFFPTWQTAIFSQTFECNIYLFNMNPVLITLINSSCRDE